MKNAISDLPEAILHTTAYADVFDYPLRPGEIHRYLTEMHASKEAVDEAARWTTQMNVETPGTDQKNLSSERAVSTYLTGD